jgi:hypothetical protein
VQELYDKDFLATTANAAPSIGIVSSCISLAHNILSSTQSLSSLYLTKISIGKITIDVIIQTPQALRKLGEFMCYKMLSPILMRMKEKGSALQYLRDLNILRHDYIILLSMLILRYDKFIEELLAIPAVE